jgi:hypothetical protein
MEGAPFLGWAGIGTDAVMPPSAFAFRVVSRQFHEEAALPIICLLMPFPGPLSSPKVMCFEPSILIRVGSVTLCIKLKDDGPTVFILPVSRQDRTILGRKAIRDSHGRCNLASASCDAQGYR